MIDGMEKELKVLKVKRGGEIIIESCRNIILF